MVDFVISYNFILFILLIDFICIIAIILKPIVHT